MRIALTHNLQLHDTEDEAEFDRPETIAALCAALRSSGHVVHPVEVSGPAAHTVAVLESLAPELVFNTAEGRHGRFREAFFPALFDELGLAYTGSDAYVCALTLDKHLTKKVVAEHGVPVPRGVFVTSLDDLQAVADLQYPIILKPNYEGSSKGITPDSVLADPELLPARLRHLLAKFPDGILVEEFVCGRDITVPFVEGISPHTGGVLAPAEYLFAGDTQGDRTIYDYTRKQGDGSSVSVRVPAAISPEIHEKLIDASRRAIRALQIRDLARLDFRLTPDGDIRFLEVNALPSLEPGASLHESAALAGCTTVAQVLDAVCRSAIARRGGTLGLVRTRPLRERLRVGLLHNLRRPVAPGEDPQAQAEFDGQSTIDSIAEAIAAFGHEVVLLEATPELPTKLLTTRIDVAFNIAEGLRGRSREAQVPALLEMLDIPYTGSDAVALSLTLDKGLAKRVVALAGVHTPKFFVMKTGRERLPKGFTFPLIVKPVAEGSSKGVDRSSVVTDEAMLRTRVQTHLQRYNQPMLVEEFLPGREFTLGILGGRRPRVLPAMEIVFTDKTDPHPVYGYEDKFGEDAHTRYETPAAVDPKLARALERAARKAFVALGCRDVARVDFRLDAAGNVHFIECNPLPGLTPGFSDLCVIAEAASMSFRDLIGEILAPALRRRKRALATRARI